MKGTKGILQEDKKNKLRIEINIFMNSFCHIRMLKRNILSKLMRRIEPKRTQFFKIPINQRNLILLPLGLLFY